MGIHYIRMDHKLSAGRDRRTIYRLGLLLVRQGGHGRHVAGRRRRTRDARPTARPHEPPQGIHYRMLARLPYIVLLSYSLASLTQHHTKYGQNKSKTFFSLNHFFEKLHRPHQSRFFIQCNLITFNIRHRAF